MLTSYNTRRSRFNPSPPCELEIERDGEAALRGSRTERRDGPMLIHCLQELEGRKIELPHRPMDRPLRLRDVPGTVPEPSRSVRLVSRRGAAPFRSVWDDPGQFRLPFRSVLDVYGDSQEPSKSVLDVL
jgi:hypothetical protein